MEGITFFFEFIFSFVVMLFPLVVSGPVTSMIFVSIAKKRRISLIHFLLLLVVNGLSLFLILGNRYLGWEDLFCLIPVAIFVSWRVLFSSDILTQIDKVDQGNQMRFYVGVFLILFLQLLVVVIAMGIMDL